MKKKLLTHKKIISTVVCSPVSVDRDRFVPSGGGLFELGKRQGWIGSEEHVHAYS
jgi:hypothetical protein